jgi:hypothetical protein
LGHQPEDFAPYPLDAIPPQLKLFRRPDEAIINLCRDFWHESSTFIESDLCIMYRRRSAEQNRDNA